MGSINSITLWLTLAAVGIATPILIHLIRRIRIIQWGAMAILERVLRRRRKRVRTEDLIVLLLRCLALLMLALALLRPTLLGRAGAWFLGSRRVGMVVAIDGSYSMMLGENDTRFADAKRVARSVLSTLKSGDPVAVVLMGARPHVVLKTTGYEEDSVDRMLSRLEARPEPLNLEASLETVRELLSGIETPVRECVIISDAQTHSWGDLSGQSRSILASLSEDQEDRRQELYFIAVAGNRSENVALTRLEFAGGTLRKNAVARFIAEVVNHGDQPRRRIAVQLLVDDETVDTRMIHELPPGGRRVITFNVPFEAAGSRRLVAVIDDDPALAIDNQRHAVVQIPPSIRVLIVEPEPYGADSPRAETYFLQKALGLKGSGPAIGIQMETIAPVELSDHAMDDVDVIILADPPDISSAAADRVMGAVRDGCGLILFLGETCDPLRINSAWGTPSGFLPAEIGRAVRLKPGQALSLEVADSTHPIGRALADLPVNMLSSARFHGYAPLRPGPSARTILRLSDGEPLLVEASVGSGKVLIFGSSADRTWNDLVINPANPVWLHTAVSALTGGGIESRHVGQRLRFEATERAIGTTPTLVAPGGQSRVGRVRRNGTGAEIDLGHVDQPGFYALRINRSPGPLTLAVNVDPAEADVRAMDPDALADAFAKIDVRLLPRDSEIEGAITTQRVGYEFWRILLTLGLVALVGQAVLADRFSRRIVMQSPQQGSTG